jgi:hypothetical protein
MTARNPDFATARRKAAQTSLVRVGSRHWFGVFVNTWMAVAPMATPRSGAVSTPPWMET